MSPLSTPRRRLLAVTASLLSGPTLAQTGSARADGERLSDRPVRIIVPFPPGGGGDISTRMVADLLASKLGVQVIVDNKPGGDGVIAVRELLRAAPDGHTIMFGSPTALLYAPQLTPKKPPYDPIRDLAPITHFSSFSYFLHISDQVPVKTMSDLVAYVHSNPGKIAYGTGDSTQLVAMAQLCAQAKLDMTHVPYKGTAAAFPDFMGDRIQIILCGADLVERFKGRARPLVALTLQRSPILPQVPTLAESGLAPLTIKPWTAFFAPAKTPRAIINQLNSGFDAAFQTPKLQEYFKGNGQMVEASAPEVVHKILVEQLPVFAQAIKTFNLYTE